MYFVYVLIDPRDDAVRYVGMTNDVYHRFAQHIRCEGNNITKNLWITELRELNHMVIMRTIETVETLEEVRAREVYWIRQYLAMGADLLNCTGTKSITFDEFMSFFQDGTDNDPDLEEEIPLEPKGLQASPQRTVKKKLTRNVYTSDEAARIANCSLREIKTALEHGRLMTAKSSGKILKSSLEKFIAERRQKNKLKG